MKKYFLWSLLAVPGLAMIFGLILGNSTYDSIMHSSGEFAGRFLIITLIASPIAVLFPSGKFGRWLVRNRRYLGVATFGYTLLHTVLYLSENSLDKITQELFEWGLLTGWLAFFIFIPLAVTSNDFSVRKMGKSWKTLQRLVYFAAILTYAHWILIHNHWTAATVHFAPVLILEIARVIKLRSKA